MFAAFGKVEVFCPNQLNREAGKLDHTHVINVQREGRDILQEILQEQSGGNGLDEPIGGGFRDWNLKVVVAVNGEGGHTRGYFFIDLKSSQQEAQRASVLLTVPCREDDNSNTQQLVK
ncbi:hypothetical protein AMATHDRAFT_11158 [Amanita thiersii Skay4041]|uniref:Uncharacterized protein n=1 Tax=Amanita thiersii Skay4041 TaxID=703135 RepID=A0A2A9NAE9_9AGAR|nr:hypothetical protein AMATHDRAFT_11158 [Amanita thiersii Skay4041]